MFAALRVAAVAGLEPISYPDTPSYLRLDFAGGELRLWTVPLLYTAVARAVGHPAAAFALDRLLYGSGGIEPDTGSR